MTALLLTAALLTPPPTSPSTRDPPLVVTGCEGLDRTELRRQLRVELDHVEGSRSGHRLELRCAATFTELQIVAANDRPPRRRILPAGVHAGDERMLALVFGELWTARTQEPRATAPTPAEPPKPAAEPPVRDEPPKPPPPAPWATEALLAVAAAGRSLASDPLLSGRAGVGIRQRLSPRVRLRISGFFEFARVRPSLGEVRAFAAGATLTPEFRVAQRNRFALDLGPQLSGGWGRISGTSDRSEVRRASSDAPFIDAGASVLASLGLPTTRVGVAVAAGYRLRQPEGTVQNDRPVTLGGPWVSLTGEVAFGLRRARR